MDRQRRRPSRPRSPCAVPDGASSFVVVVQLDDLGRGEVLGRLGGEPHHQHGADREVRRVEDGDAALRASSSTLRRSQPVVPIDARDARVERARATFATTASGCVKSTIASAPSSARRRASAPGRLERGRERRAPTFPPRPLRQDLHAAARASGRGDALERRRGSAPRLGPMPAADSRSGASSTAASSATLDPARPRRPPR